MTFYVWLDLETTGLDERNCKIIEAAAIITTEEFKPLASYSTVINPGGELAYEEKALGFHRKSGLVNEVANGKTIKEVEEDLLSLIVSFEPRKKRAYLAGNSVHFDRKFLNKYMPSIPSHLTSRHLDVSAIGLLMTAKYGKERAQFKGPRPHRALDDLYRSIKQLNFYINRFLISENN